MQWLRGSRSMVWDWMPARNYAGIKRKTMPRLPWNGNTDHIRCIPIPAPLKGGEAWIPPHNNGREPVTEGPHTCNMQDHGIRENNGKPYEVFVCEICQREEWREYTGTQDTIEWRE